MRWTVWSAIKWRKSDRQRQEVVWRKLDRAVRSLTAKLHPRLARFGAINLAETIEPEAVEKFLEKKVALQQEVQELQTQLQERAAGWPITWRWVKSPKRSALIG